MNLANQTVIVVGGASGIGLSVARAALAKGASVVLASRSQHRLDRALATLEGGARARAVVADITREADVAGLFRAVSTVDHVVVTAADMAYQPITSFEVDAARRVIDSKLLGSVLIAKHGAPRLRAGGSLTLTSGIASERPAPKGALVAAVNGALAGLVRALAIELAPLRVNALSPGWIDTDIWDTVVGDAKAAAFTAMAKRLPAGRIGRAEEVAHAALFLMESTFTTGTVLHVDGGHRLV